MSIRVATLSDLDAILALFSQTIQEINAKDYSPAQIRVWSSLRNEEAWKQKLEAQYFIVKEMDKAIVGFSSLEPDGYLDFLYVHARRQRQGIASELLEAILSKATEQHNAKVWTSSSITAQPFFEKYGFVLTQKEIKHVEGVKFVNAVMERPFN